MNKNIIVCSDGTGNSGIKDRGTNVFKMFESIDLNGHRLDPSMTPQIAFYDDGVGTQDLKWLKTASGATGLGLSRNVRHLYAQIVRVYDPGDRIYMFGFSRGAFTVRTLAGFIGTAGLIDLKKLTTKSSAGLDAAVKEAYSTYRQCYRTTLQKILGLKTKGDPGAAFRRAYAYDLPVRVHFIGVWDTVDAVGVPFHISDVINSTIYRFKFPDHSLSDHIDRASHALAIDDERESFAPLIWDEGPGTEGRLNQVWFSGAHANVGGGYPKQGMSLVALDWMMAEAEAAGLRILPDDRATYRHHANVDDKLYDSRSGLGMFYRWRIRDIHALSAERGITRPKIHSTVVERIAHGPDNYAPGNLPPNAAVVSTRPRDAADAPLLAARAAEMERVLRDRLGGGLLPAMKSTIRLEVASYYVFVVGCVLAVVAASGVGHFDALRDPVAFAIHIGRFLIGITTRPIIAGKEAWQALISTNLAIWAIAGIVLALVVSSRTKSTMRATFTEFWAVTQPVLRHSLQHARKVFDGA